MKKNLKIVGLIGILIGSIFALLNFMRNLPCPGIDIDAAGGSKLKATCISYKLGLKEYFNKKGEE